MKGKTKEKLEVIQKREDINYYLYNIENDLFDWKNQLDDNIGHMIRNLLKIDSNFDLTSEYVILNSVIDLIIKKSHNFLIKGK